MSRVVSPSPSLSLSFALAFGVYDRNTAVKHGARLSFSLSYWRALTHKRAAMTNARAHKREREREKMYVCVRVCVCVLLAAAAASARLRFSMREPGGAYVPHNATPARHPRSLGAQGGAGAGGKREREREKTFVKVATLAGNFE